MPTVKSYRRYGLRYLLLNLLSALPFVPVFAFVWFRASAGVWNTWTWCGIAAFSSGAAFGLWWQHRRQSRIKCPACRQLIVRDRAHPLRAGDPINFHCRRCDVMWVTGLLVSEE